MKTGKLAAFGLLLGALLWLLPIHAQEIPQPLPPAKNLPDKSASTGKLLVVDLSKPGPLITLPLAARAPGKYIATLRLKFTPVDSDAQDFTLVAGSSARTFAATFNPDPADSDYRLWTLPILYDAKAPLELKILLDRPRALADAPARQLLLDRVTLHAVGPACIESIRPNKVCYDPNEEIACDIVLRQPRPSMQLRALESIGLEEPREVARAPVPPSGKITLHWNAGPEQYGRNLKIELVENNRTLDSASDVYNVTDNVWKVALAATVDGVHMTDPRSIYCAAKTDDQLAHNINVGARASYGNFKESFAWAPDDALDMTPTQDTWISGQGCYQHQRSRIILMNKLLRDNGIWPITYAKSAASGPPAFEFMRTHPQWALSGFQSQFDQEYVEKWDRQIPGQEKTIFYTWMSCVLNIARPDVVDTAISQILASSQMFGWRGARYDDHYSLWGQPASETSTKNMQRIFELGSKNNPDFTWGFNYLTSNVPFAWPRSKNPGPSWKQQSPLPDPPNPCIGPTPLPYPEFTVACSHGALIMNEEARSASQKSGPYPAPGTYSNYAQLLTAEARLTRSLGGHYCVIPFDAPVPSAFDAIYPDILRAATRTHTYGQIKGGPDMLRFLTRYSAFIYGADLQPLPDPDNHIQLDAAPLPWWHNFVYRRQHAGDSQIVIHLLSPPHDDRIFNNKTGEIPKTHALSLAYTGPGTVVKAWELSPFIENFQRPLPVTDNHVKPSEFYLWKIVVLQLGN